MQQSSKDVIAIGHHADKKQLLHLVRPQLTQDERIIPVHEDTVVKQTVSDSDVPEENVIPYCEDETPSEEDLAAIAKYEREQQYNLKNAFFKKDLHSPLSPRQRQKEQDTITAWIQDNGSRYEQTRKQLSATVQQRQAKREARLALFVEAEEAKDNTEQKSVTRTTKDTLEKEHLRCAPHYPDEWEEHRRTTIMSQRMQELQLPQPPQWIIHFADSDDPSDLQKSDNVLWHGIRGFVSPQGIVAYKKWVVGGPLIENKNISYEIRYTPLDLPYVIDYFRDIVLNRIIAEHFNTTKEFWDTYISALVECMRIDPFEEIPVHTTGLFNVNNARAKGLSNVRSTKRLVFREATEHIREDQMKSTAADLPEEIYPYPSHIIPSLRDIIDPYLVAREFLFLLRQRHGFTLLEDEARDIVDAQFIADHNIRVPEKELSYAREWVFADAMPCYGGTSRFFHPERLENAYQSTVREFKRTGNFGVLSGNHIVAATGIDAVFHDLTPVGRDTAGVLQQEYASPGSKHFAKHRQRFGDTIADYHLMLKRSSLRRFTSEDDARDYLYDWFGAFQLREEVLQDIIDQILTRNRSAELHRDHLTGIGMVLFINYYRDDPEVYRYDRSQRLDVRKDIWEE